MADPGGTGREPEDRVVANVVPDLASDPGVMLADVVEGLSRPQKELDPKYFYDGVGSTLFEEITQLPEYYLTRTERALLERWMPDWIGSLLPASFVELGAGAATKSRIILDVMVDRGVGELYVPMDVSAGFLEETTASLRAEYPGLRIEGWAADMTQPFEAPADLPRPALFALLGSTIGNFYPDAAVDLLSGVRSAMDRGDGFLLGVDLRPGPGKDRDQLEAAYNDARGVTAEFNRNVLAVLNRELGADFDLGAYRHRAVYDDHHGWIEMHLVADMDQVVEIPGGGRFEIAAGEHILTEVSGKYDRATVEDLAGRAGLDVSRWTADPRGRFALTLLTI